MTPAERYRRDAGPENWDRYQQPLRVALRHASVGDDAAAALAFLRTAHARAAEDPVTDTLGHLLSLVRYLRNTDRMDAAEITAREALAYSQALYPSPHRDIVYAKDRLKQILQRQRKYAEVVDLEETTVADYESLHGARSAHVAGRLVELARCHRFADQRDRAEAALRRSIEILEDDADAHLRLQAWAHMQLRQTVGRTNVAEAIVESERALALFRRAGLSDGDKEVWVNLKILRELTDSAGLKP